MRILYINSVCGVGSTGRIVTDLASAAAVEGNECFIAYGIGDAKNIDPLRTIKISNPFEYYFSNFLSKATGLTGCYNGLATIRLIQYIEKIQPDMVHMHNLHGYYLNVFKLFNYLRKKNIPIVWTLHDCWAYTGNCSHYSYVGCERWKEACGSCPQKSRYPQTYFFDFSRFLLKRKKEIFTKIGSMYLTTPSKWLAGEVQQSFLKKYPCLPIYNGMDTAAFDIAESKFKVQNHLQNKKIVLGVANAWGAKKGLFDFYKLSELLPDGYRVVLVGLSDSQLQALPSNIIGITRTSNIEELVDIYNAADVFVNPSYEETFGMTSIEALLCGVQVVAYNKTALPEVISSKYGVVVEAGDGNGLADAVVRLQPADRSEVRKTALKYGKENMTKQFMDLYKSILSRDE